MDAVKYLKEKSRMVNGCKAYEVCEICPLSENENGRDLECNDFELDYPEEAVEIVAKWAAEHPVKTRQSEFLRMYPDALINDGVLRIHPCDMDTGYIAQADDQCRAYAPRKSAYGCRDCRRDYWLAEVE